MILCRGLPSFLRGRLLRFFRQIFQMGGDGRRRNAGAYFRRGRGFRRAGRRRSEFMHINCIPAQRYAIAHEHQITHDNIGILNRRQSGKRSSIERHRDRLLISNIDDKFLCGAKRANFAGAHLPAVRRNSIGRNGNPHRLRGPKLEVKGIGHGRCDGSDRWGWLCNGRFSRREGLLLLQRSGNVILARNGGLAALRVRHSDGQVRNASKENSQQENYHIGRATRTADWRLRRIAGVASEQWRGRALREWTVFTV